jgi:methionyl-tRNA formyltransferase
LLETLPGIAGGELEAMPQNDAAATYAPKLSKKDGQVDFTKTVREVHNQIRGTSPWPGAWCVLQRESERGGETLRIKIFPGQPVLSEADAAPGTVLGIVDDNLAICCADGVYLISQVCPANSTMMNAPEFVRGYLHQAEVFKAVFNDD